MTMQSRAAAISSIAVVVAVIVGTSASTVDAQDASAAPSAVTEFSATLSADQTQHRATALNLKYDFPNEFCKDGLDTYSVDQSMTFTADPVVVEVATFDSPLAGWGSQDAFIYARAARRRMSSRSRIRLPDVRDTAVRDHRQHRRHPQHCPARGG